MELCGCHRAEGWCGEEWDKGGMVGLRSYMALRLYGGTCIVQWDKEHLWEHQDRLWDQTMRHH